MDRGPTIDPQCGRAGISAGFVLHQNFKRLRQGKRVRTSLIDQPGGAGNRGPGFDQSALIEDRPGVYMVVAAKVLLLSRPSDSLRRACVRLSATPPAMVIRILIPVLIWPPGRATIARSLGSLPGRISGENCRSLGAW